MKKRIIFKSTALKCSLHFLALLPGVLLATSAVTASAKSNAENVSADAQKLADEAAKAAAEKAATIAMAAADEAAKVAQAAADEAARSEEEVAEAEEAAREATAKAAEIQEAEAAREAEAAKAAETKAREEEARKEETDKPAETGKETEAPNETKGPKAEIQSPARPFGLDIVGPVMEGGSDEKSAVFQKEVLPGMTKFLEETLGERTALDDSRMLLDPEQLKLKTASDVRVYFVGEGTVFANTLGFDPTGKGINSENAKLIFPDSSSTVSYYDPADKAERKSWAPLLPGDFVSLGKLESGSVLDFFLITDGANGGNLVFSADRSANADGINHAVAFAYQKANSPYLILGFEDLYGGGDRDFNDLVFAVDIGAANVKALTSAPEPAMALTLVSFLGMTLRRKRSLKLA